MVGPRTSGAISVDVYITDLNAVDNVEEIARRTNGTLEESTELADGKGLENQYAFGSSQDAYEFRMRVSRTVSGIGFVGLATPGNFREFI